MVSGRVAGFLALPASQPPCARSISWSSFNPRNLVRDHPRFTRFRGPTICVPYLAFTALALNWQALFSRRAPQKTCVPLVPHFIFEPFAGQCDVNLKAFWDSPQGPTEYGQSDDWRTNRALSRSVFSFPVIASVLSIRPNKLSRTRRAGRDIFRCAEPITGAASDKIRLRDSPAVPGDGNGRRQPSTEGWSFPFLFLLKGWPLTFSRGSLSLSFVFSFYFTCLCPTQSTPIETHSCV